MTEQAVASRIERLRRLLYVHSTIYYRYCTSVISDRKFDEWARELAQLQHQYPNESEEVALFREEFRSWDGSSGYHLPPNPGIERAAARLIEIERSYNEKEAE